MIRERVRMRGSGRQLSRSESFSLLSSLPSEFTFARADASTVATVRGSDGKLGLVAANTPRFDHDISGNPLGLLMEEERTNLCTNVNISPPDTTGFTTTGTASVTRVYDTASVAAAKLDGIITDSYIIQLSGGASGGTVTIDGTTGATGAFSASMYAKALSGPTASFGITPEPTKTQISGSTMTWHRAQNMTATATTDKITFTLGVFSVIRIALNQLEAGVCSTSPIKVNGATAKRYKELAVDLNFSTRPYYNQSKGAFVALAKPYAEDAAATAFVVGSGDGLYPNNAFYVLRNATSLYSNATAKGAGTAYNAGVISKIPNDKYSPIGISWINGTEITLLTGFGQQKTVAAAIPATGIDRMAIGAIFSNAWQFNGHIKQVSVFYGSRPSSSKMMQSVINSTDSHKIIVNAGQSNAENMSGAPVNYKMSGARSVMDQMNSVYPYSSNWYLSGALGGTFAASWRGSGDSITKWKNTVNAAMAAGGEIIAIHWDQGESDIGNPKDTFKTWYKEIFDDMRSVVGDVPIYVTILGKLATTATQAHQDNCTLIRQAYLELAQENAYIKLTPDKFIHPMYDTTHLSDVGYGAHGHLVARKILKDLGESVSGGVDGPTIKGVSRSGASITVTLSHDSGTDFTPTTGIEGFIFYDNTTVISISSAVRASAATITLTLASTPSNAVQRLDYCAGSLFGVDTSNTVRDNQTYPLPLRTSRWDSSDTGATFTKTFGV